MTTKQRSEVTTVTPEFAEVLLTSNHKNRTIRPRRVAQYAADMKNGRWMLTGEPVIVATDGTLLNGQHGLLAVIESGCAIEMLIVYGVTPDAFKVLDSGLARTASDVLRQQEHAQAPHVAAVVRLVLGWREDALLRQERMAVIATRSAISDFAERHREALSTVMGIAQGLYRAVGGNRTAWGALAFELTVAGVADFDDFAEGVRTGANLEVGAPQLALRNWLAGTVSRGHYANTHLATYTRAWNAFAEDEDLTLLKTWKKAVSNKFPRPLIEGSSA